MGVFDWLRLRKDPPPPARRARRSYAAAAPTRLASGWITQPMSADRDIRHGLQPLRARSREEAQNNGYAKGFLREVRSNVVGHKGIQLRAKPTDPPRQALDLPQVDILAKRAIEKAWKKWGKRSSFPDVSGRLSWTGILSKAITETARDGEFIVQIMTGPDLNEFGFALKFRDPNHLDVELNRDRSATQNSIIMGVEVDINRRPVAYHFHDSPSTLQTIGGYQIIRKHTRIPADEILHGYLDEEGVLQTRGVPWMAPGLLRFNMLGGYEEAELVAARAAAAKMGWIIDAPDDEFGYSGDSDPDAPDEGYEYIEEVEAGYFGRLPHGADAKFYDPQHPNTAFKEFVKTNLRGVAAGLGISYNALASDLEGVNYSSLREGRLRESALWMMLQEWLIENLVEPVFDRWLLRALLTGKITLETGGRLAPERIEKYSNVEWAPRRWPWVDPQKEGAAMRERVSINFSSVSEEIRATGRDPEEVYREIAEERETWDRLGIAPAAASDTLQQNEPASESPEDQD